MVSLNIAFGGGAVAAAAVTRGKRRSVLIAATSSTTAGKSAVAEEKGILDWILGGLEKDQLLETDPLLNKVEKKNGSVNSRKSPAAPATPVEKKSGGFNLGDIFSKK